MGGALGTPAGNAAAGVELGTRAGERAERRLGRRSWSPGCVGGLQGRSAGGCRAFQRSLGEEEGEPCAQLTQKPPPCQVGHSPPHFLGRVSGRCALRCCASRSPRPPGLDQAPPPTGHQGAARTAGDRFPSSSGCVPVLSLSFCSRPSITVLPVPVRLLLGPRVPCTRPVTPVPRSWGSKWRSGSMGSWQPGTSPPADLCSQRQMGLRATGKVGESFPACLPLSPPPSFPHVRPLVSGHVRGRQAPGPLRQPAL